MQVPTPRALAWAARMGAVGGSVQGVDPLGPEGPWLVGLGGERRLCLRLGDPGDPLTCRRYQIQAAALVLAEDHDVAAPGWSRWISTAPRPDSWHC